MHKITQKKGREVSECNAAYEKMREKKGRQTKRVLDSSGRGGKRKKVLIRH